MNKSKVSKKYRVMETTTCWWIIFSLDGSLWLKISHCSEICKWYEIQLLFFEFFSGVDFNVEMQG